MKKQIIPMVLALAIASINAEQTVNYTYNTKGQLTQIEGARTDVKDVTQYSYTSTGQLQSITNALGHKIIYSNFNAQGQPQTITDENGVNSTLTYNTEGQVTSITTAGLKTVLEYDAVGQITKIIMPDNSWISYTWDNAKRLTAITNNQGESIQYTLDLMGNRTVETIKKGSTITRQIKRQFDELGRVSKIIGAAGQTKQYTYSTHDKPITETEPNGLKTTNTYNQRVNLKYDGIQKDNSTSYTEYNLYEYNYFDEASRLADSGGTNTYYNYDEFGQVIEENRYASYASSGLIQKYQYDKAGNTVQQTNARGHSIHYQYDALNRLITEIYINNRNLDVQYQYDQVVSGYYNVGKLTTIKDTSGTTEYNYNNLGLITQQKNQLMLDNAVLGSPYTTHYTYDKAGRISSVDMGTLTVNYTRNTSGQVTAITLKKGSVTSSIVNNISYQPFGDVTTLTWGNGVNLTRSYNLDGQLATQQIGTVTIQYSYDANGNIIAINDSLWGNSQYQYDQRDRLIQEQGNYPITYTYNVTGGRTSKKTATETQQVNFTTGNRISSIPGQAYAADTTDNVLYYKDKNTQYEYDEANRFSKVIKVSGSTKTQLARYIHNAYGERTIKVKQDGSISSFMYNEQGQLIEETQYSASKQKLKEVYWIWLDSLPVAQIEVPFINNVAGTQTISYLHADHLNTPRWATNANKQTVWTWQSDAYGTTIAKEDPSNTGTKTAVPLRFPGQYYDQETGFHYNYFRTYIPELGRYSQSDPIGLDGGWNRFAYVRGNPLINADESGLNVGTAVKVGRYGYMGAQAAMRFCTQNPSACKAGLEAMIHNLQYMDGLGNYNGFPELKECPTQNKNKNKNKNKGKGYKNKENKKDNGLLDNIKNSGWDPRDPDDHEKICDYLRSLGQKGRATFKSFGCDGRRF